MGSVTTVHTSFLLVYSNLWEKLAWLTPSLPSPSTQTVSFILWLFSLIEPIRHSCERSHGWIWHFLSTQPNTFDELLQWKKKSFCFHEQSKHCMAWLKKSRWNEPETVHFRKHLEKTLKGEREQVRKKAIEGIMMVCVCVPLYYNIISACYITSIRYF